MFEFPKSRRWNARWIWTRDDGRTVVATGPIRSSTTHERDLRP